MTNYPNINWEHMSTVIDVINMHIIGNTESWCHKDINESEIHIDGYTTYRRDQECAKGGGVLLCVSNNLESNYCSTLNIHKFNDSIWCIVNLHKNIKLLVGVCYRSPSYSEENNRALAELISKVLNEPHITHILIFGD